MHFREAYKVYQRKGLSVEMRFDYKFRRKVGGLVIGDVISI